MSQHGFLYPYTVVLVAGLPHNKYVALVTHDECKRWLVKQGATFEEGKRHTIVWLNGRRSVVPRHGRKDLPKGTLAAIKKQLGLA